MCVYVPPINQPSITHKSPIYMSNVSPINHPSITHVSPTYHPSITNVSPINHPSITHVSPIHHACCRLSVNSPKSEAGLKRWISVPFFVFYIYYILRHRLRHTNNFYYRGVILIIIGMFVVCLCVTVMSVVGMWCVGVSECALGSTVICDAGMWCVGVSECVYVCV